MPHQQALPLADWPPGFRHLPGHLPDTAQRALLADVLTAVEGAGWFQPTMPRSGRPMSVRMCNLGPLGWVTDREGYRYQATHPDTGRPWPPMPAALPTLWSEVTGWPELVLSRGDVVARDGNFVGEPSRGRFLERAPSSR